MNLDDLLKSIREEDGDSKESKINGEKFLKRKTFENPLKGQKFTAPSVPGAGAGAGTKETIKPVAVKIEPEKLIPQSDQKKSEEISEELIQKINELILVIKADNELEKDQQKFVTKALSKSKREEREKRVEKKNPFSSVQKTLGTVKKKFSGIIDTVIRFLTFTVLGGLLSFVTNFLQNPKNQKLIGDAQEFVRSIPGRLTEAREKIQPVIDFFVETVPKIRKFAEDFRLLLTQFPFLGNVFKTEEEKEAEAAEKAAEKAAGLPPEKELFIDPNTGFGRIPTFKGGYSGGGMLSMGTDTVPAMLTPGEFVMSRGAVSMFGADTMMKMNKAGGGTNRPKFGLISGYQSGGLVEQMGMNRSQFEIYKREIAKIESEGSGGYAAIGGHNDHYDGKYQMSKVAKQDAARILGEDFIGHDKSSRAIFRADPEMQERYFAAYTRANHGYLLSNEKYRNASPEKKLSILGYAHNQGWSKADNWLNSGEVGRDSFGTAGTKYADAINAAFSGSKMPPVLPTINSPGSPESLAPSFGDDKTAIQNLKKISKERLREIRKQENFDFIYNTLRKLLPLPTPNVNSSTKIIVLPTVKQTATNKPSVQFNREQIPNFTVSSGIKMRGMVGKALGIEDLVS